MNYREKMRAYIECPQFGNIYYGKWGALNLEQRKLIKRLLDEMESADDYIKKLFLENEQLKDNWKHLKQALLDIKECIEKTGGREQTFMSNLQICELLDIVNKALEVEE